MTSAMLAAFSPAALSMLQIPVTMMEVLKRIHK